MPSELEGLNFFLPFCENRMLGCLGSILEASWIVLVKFLGRLGPQDAHLGRQDAPKMSPRPARK